MSQKSKALRTNKQPIKKARNHKKYHLKKRIEEND